MKTSFLFICFFICAWSFGQPVLQASDFMGSIGESTIKSNVIFPNATDPIFGNDVIWDYSNVIPSTTDTLSFGTPNSDFPLTNNTLRTSGVREVYRSINDNEILEYGLRGLSYPDSVLYSDPVKLYQFPLSTSTTFDDTFASKILGLSIYYERNGKLSIDVVGCGTLILPDSKYDDVLLIRYREVGQAQGFGFSYPFDNHFYSWHIACHPFQLANLFFSDYPSAKNFYFTTPSESNLAKCRVNGVEISPNPAANITTVKSENKIKAISIVDLTGSEVFNLSGMNTKFYEINVSQLKCGIYYINIETEKEIVKKKFVVL